MSQVESEPARTTLSPDEKRARRAKYNRSYYEAHDADLKDRKRNRYHADPAYRDRVKTDSASRRVKNTDASVPVVCGGNPDRAHRACVLAERLGVSISTVNFWQKHGTLPETPFRTPGGYRLYTDGMIEAVRQALGAYPRPSRGCPLFLFHVATSWQALGVPG